MQWKKDKLLVMSNFFFFHSVFKRLALQTHENQTLFGEGLKYCETFSSVIWIIYNFPACDEFHWGENCNNDCNCGVGATSCDPTVGCVCEAGWSGVLCDIDRNECASSPVPCSGDNQQCTNTPGSYVCSCLDGYEDIAGNCES